MSFVRAGHHFVCIVDLPALLRLLGLGTFLNGVQNAGGFGACCLESENKIRPPFGRAQGVGPRVLAARLLLYSMSFHSSSVRATTRVGAHPGCRVTWSSRGVSPVPACLYRRSSWLLSFFALLVLVLSLSLSLPLPLFRPAFFVIGRAVGGDMFLPEPDPAAALQRHASGTCPELIKCVSCSLSPEHL